MPEEKETYQDITIKLPVSMIKKIQKDIEGTSFKGVEGFITSLVLQKYPELRKPDYTKEEEEIIKERLRKLGYLG